MIAGPHDRSRRGSGCRPCRPLRRPRAGSVGTSKVPVVAAEAVDGKFDRPAARLDDAGAANAGHAARVLDARRHLSFQPADRGRVRRARIGESPGAAARLALAARRAGRRIAVADFETGVIAAAAVIADLRLRGGRDQRARADQDERKSACAARLISRPAAMLRRSLCRNSEKECRKKECARRRGRRALRSGRRGDGCGIRIMRPMGGSAVCYCGRAPAQRAWRDGRLVGGR